MHYYNGFCVNFTKVLNPEYCGIDVTEGEPENFFTEEMEKNKEHCYDFLLIDESTKFCRFYVVVDNNFTVDEVLTNVNISYGSLTNMLNMHWGFGKYTEDGWVPAKVKDVSVHTFQIDEEFLQKIKKFMGDEKLLHHIGRYLNTKSGWWKFENEFNKYFELTK